MSAYLIEQITSTGNITVVPQVTVTGVDGDDWLRRLTDYDLRGGSSHTAAAHALFVCIGGEPRTQWAADDQLALDQRGYLLTGSDLPAPPAGLPWPLDRDPDPLETNRPGLFVAGEVRHGSTRRVATAVGEGAMAIHLVHRHLTAA